MPEKKFPRMIIVKGTELWVPSTCALLNGGLEKNRDFLYARAANAAKRISRDGKCYCSHCPVKECENRGLNLFPGAGKEVYEFFPPVSEECLIIRKGGDNWNLLCEWGHSLGRSVYDVCGLKADCNVAAECSQYSTPVALILD